MTETLVPHTDLFYSQDDRYDVGELREDAVETLNKIRASGSRIVVTGPITDTWFGTKALLSRLIDLNVPFDDIDQTSRYTPKG
jgi:hypothetical protein